MRDGSIEGIGTIYGGDYETITIGGISKLKGDATAKDVIVEGLFKVKGRIICDRLKCDGVIRAFRDIEVGTMEVDGVLKARRAQIHGDKISCEGILVSTGEISADIIRIDGICSVAALFGDKVNIGTDENIIRSSGKIPGGFSGMTRLYFGRKIDMDYSLVDTIECTRLEAKGLKAKVVRAHEVKLQECVIETLDCSGDMIIDKSCRIGRILSGGEPISMEDENDRSTEGDVKMVNKNLVKILDLYKEGRITAEEAETMIGGIGGNEDHESLGLPWEDDGKLRIVAYMGRKLLKKGEAGARDISVEYEGEALNVSSYGNIICGDIQGSASAGGSIECDGNIKGNVSSGGKIRCKSVKGNISAGGGVQIGELGAIKFKEH